MNLIELAYVIFFRAADNRGRENTQRMVVQATDADDAIAKLRKRAVVQVDKRRKPRTITKIIEVRPKRDGED